MPLPPRSLLAAYGIVAAYWGMFAIVMSFFPFRVRDLGGSYLQVSVLTTVLALAPVLAVNAWTALRDSRGRTRPFLVAGTLAAALTMVVPFIASTPAGFIGAVAVLALVHCCVEPLVDAHVTVVSGLPAGEAAGALKRAGSVGFFAASLLGAWLYGLGGVRAASALGLAACGAAVALSLLIEERDGDAPREGAGMDLSFLLSRGPVAAVCATNLLLSAARFGFISLAPLYLVSLGAGESWMGYLNAAATLLAIAVLPRVGRLAGQGGATRLLLLGIAGYLAVFLSLGALSLAPLGGTAVASVPWDSLRIALALALWGIPLYVLVEVPPVALVAEHTSEGERARGMGAVSFSLNAGSVAGPLAAGWLATAYGGFLPAIAFSAAVSGLALAYAARSLPRGSGA